jgi:hypothetical protein
LTAAYVHINGGEGVASAPCHPTVCPSSVFLFLCSSFAFSFTEPFAMGADGGSIPDRRDLVKTKGKAEVTDKALLRELYYLCALSKVSRTETEPALCISNAVTLVTAARAGPIVADPPLRDRSHDRSCSILSASCTTRTRYSSSSSTAQSMATVTRSAGISRV